MCQHADTDRYQQVTAATLVLYLDYFDVNFLHLWLRLVILIRRYPPPPLLLAGGNSSLNSESGWLWVVGRGSWVVGRGSWVASRGSAGRRMWDVGCGMGCKLRVVGRGMCGCSEEEWRGVALRSEGGTAPTSLSIFFFAFLASFFTFFIFFWAFFTFFWISSWDGGCGGEQTNANRTGV